MSTFMVSATNGAASAFQKGNSPTTYVGSVAPVPEPPNRNRRPVQSFHPPRPYHSVMWDSADEALVAGLAAGDASAATALVRRFQRRVFGLAMAVLGDRGLAEDVAQEAFVRAWRHAAAYDPRRGSVATWLLTITRNLAIDTLRMRRSDPIDAATLAARGGASGGPGPPRRPPAPPPAAPPRAPRLPPPPGHHAGDRPAA